MYTLHTTLKADPGGYLRFEIPAEQGEQLLANGNKRITVTLPGGHVAHLSVATPKTGGYWVQFSKELARNKMLTHGMSVSLKLAVDESPHQFAVPEEVQFLLDTDDDFKQAFLALRPGARRSLLFWAGYTKNELERAERATHLAEQVIAGQSNAQLISKHFRRSELALEEMKTLRQKRGSRE